MATKLARCCCCGQIIPPAVKLPRIKQRIYDYVKAHPAGVTSDQIMDNIYADDPNGGPSGRSVVSVHVNQMNSDYLAAYGLQIRSTLGPGALFTLRPLP